MGDIPQPRAGHVEPAPDGLAPYFPDLLNEEPSLALDHAKVRRELFVAFQTGDAEQRLERVMDDAAVSKSAWSGSSFRAGLYMDALVGQCMAVRIGGVKPKLNVGYLLRVLGHPPRDEPSVLHRRAITAELAEDAALREVFESTYLRLVDLRTQLQAMDNVGYYDSRVRRLHVLGLLRQTFESLSTDFADAKSELRRISNYAEFVCQSEAYAHLSDLLQYEDSLASVQFTMRLGADGSLRRFEICSIRENEDNRFYQAPLRRLRSKLGMWWRGYKTGEGGILDAWLEEVYRGLLRYLPALLRLMGDMEFYLAGLAFRDACLERGLAICFPKMLPVGSPPGDLRVENMFNPLLFTVGATPVPCSLRGQSFAGKTILTGPNSGGKTRFLQAVGITQILAESGLYAPAASATLPRANGLYVSLIEEGAVDQSEGRLGREMIRIRRLFERAPYGALVILDELCSGTNPSEGEEIFLLVLSLLEQLGSRAVLATHFLDFARRLEAPAQRESLSVEFLQVAVTDDGRPTYQFRPGVARTSMALRTARRLGVTDAELRTLVDRQRAAAGHGPSTRLTAAPIRHCRPAPAS